MLGTVIVPGISQVPGTADTTSGSVDTSGTNWLASLLCGDPMSIQGSTIGVPYCISYYNEQGFSAPTMINATPPLPLGYNSSTGSVDNPYIDQSDYLSSNLVSQIQEGFQNFFNTSTSDSSSGGTDITMYLLIGGIAAYLILEKAL